MSSLFRVLVVEDSDKKFEAVAQCLSAACPTGHIERAATMVEAEKKILETIWSLVVLDISMDIAPSRYGPKIRGQANIGGLAIARKMFLLEREAPTIVLTAFDSFMASGGGAASSEIFGFEEVARKASEYLPSSLIACLRYNAEGWRQQMIDAILKVVGNASLDCT